MTITDDVERLRKRAAELVEQSAHRDTPLSPEEDADILALLRQAEELELHDKHDKKTHHAAN